MCRVKEMFDTQFPQTIKWTGKRSVVGFTQLRHGRAKLLTHRSWL